MVSLLCLFVESADGVLLTSLQILPLEGFPTWIPTSEGLF